MRRLNALAFAFLVAASAAAAHGEVAIPPLQVLGSVTNAARPVANALVIALSLKDLAATQTYSSIDGRFTLPPLPAGIYKIIAVKAGFAPAIATVLPNRSNQTVKLALEDEGHVRKSKSDEMWEIRASLPPDILRELDLASAPPEIAEAREDFSAPRFRGEMVSVTGVGNDTAASTFAQTSVGVQSRIGQSWQLGVHGDLHRVDDPSDGDRFGTAAAETSVMSMELRSSAADSYRVASTKSFWRYRDAAPETQADIRSHNFEWEHGGAKLGVRYFAQDNLFVSNPFGSDLIEITGGTTLLQTGRNDLGVSLRVAQESLRNSESTEMRTADVIANGSVSVAGPLVLRYGLASRLGLEGTEVAPRTGIEWKVTGNTSLVASGMVKVLNGNRGNDTLPMVVMLSGDARVLPRYEYSVGFVAGDEKSSRFSAVASVTAIESPLRVLLSDGFDQFWDGFYIDSGDVRRDVRVTWRKDLGRLVALDIATSAGTATPVRRMASAKAYVTGDVQSIFLPTGTTLVVSYRGVHQPQENRADYRSERVNFRMAQPLHLPFDLKVLLGLDLARAENSPFLLDVIDPSNSASKKYIGGLAMTF